MEDSRPLPFHLLDFRNVVGDALGVNSTLLSAEEKKVLRSYQQLSTGAQVLSSRLYGRKRQWIRLQRIEDPDITDIINAALALQQVNFIKMYHPPDMNTKGAVPPRLPDMSLLSSLQAPELREIAKSCNVQNSSTLPRESLIKSIKTILRSKLPSGQQRLSFATGPPKSQRVALRMIAEIVGPAIHLLPNFVNPLRVAHQLFLLQTPSDAIEFILMESGNLRGHPATVLLNGMRKWPVGRKQQQEKVFKTRREFDDYEDAITDLAAVTEAAAKFPRQREEMTQLIEPIVEKHAAYLEQFCSRVDEHHCKLIESSETAVKGTSEEEIIICGSKSNEINKNITAVNFVDVDDEADSSPEVVVVSDSNDDSPAAVSPNKLILDCNSDTISNNSSCSPFSFESDSIPANEIVDVLSQMSGSQITENSDIVDGNKNTDSPSISLKKSNKRPVIEPSNQSTRPTEAEEEFGFNNENGDRIECSQQCCECDHLNIKSPLDNIFRKSYVSRLVLLEGVHPLESAKKYEPCIRFLHLILKCSRFKPRRRGRWWQRLIVDYGHLKKSEEALQTCRQSLEHKDNSFMAGSDRLWLERRYLRMLKDDKEKELPTLKGAEQVFSTTVITPLKRIVIGRKWRGSKWPMWDCATAIVKTSSVDIPPPPLTERPPTLGNVEECATQAICRSKGEGWTGRHCEGGTLQFIFVLLMWEVIFTSEVLPLRFQSIPIDFASPSFLNRLPEFTTRSKEIESFSEEDLCCQLKTSYEAHAGISAFSCTWDSTPVDVLLEVATCLGSIRTGKLCLEFCSQMQLSGMPDLLLWSPISREVLVSEVKGPGDTLSTKQEIWLTRLTQMNIPCEVCRVVDADEEEKREQKEKEKEEKREKRQQLKEEAAAKKAQRLRGSSKKEDVNNKCVKNTQTNSEKNKRSSSSGTKIRKVEVSDIDVDDADPY